MLKDFQNSLSAGFISQFAINSSLNILLNLKHVACRVTECVMYGSGDCSCIQTITLGRGLVLSLALVLIPSLTGNILISLPVYMLPSC